ncbi:MAG: beta-phosphoglucomutase family hydrolase [Spirochaetes bacterium]|nr:beta-phosphoglucomutase family hydrolase [Spirochaetota bacterium]
MNDISLYRKLEVHPSARALIFDLDGTLVDTMKIHFEAWKEVGRSNGFDYPEELFYRLAGIPTKTIVHLLNAEFGYSLDVEKISKEKEEAFLRNVHFVKPILPVVEIVETYFGILPMAIGTGNTRTIALRILKQTRLAHCFRVIVTADDVTYHKPHPETFLRCAELMHIEPQCCQVFEDGDQGLEAARRAGMIATDVRCFVKILNE